MHEDVEKFLHSVENVYIFSYFLCKPTSIHHIIFIFTILSTCEQTNRIFGHALFHYSNSNSNIDTDGTDITSAIEFRKHHREIIY